MERLRSVEATPGKSGSWGVRVVRRVLAVVLALGTFGAVLPATGQEKKETGKSRVVTISEVTIVGRIQKPIAAVDVSRIQPKLTLAELHQPFIQRVEAAIYGVPF